MDRLFKTAKDGVMFFAIENRNRTMQSEGIFSNWERALNMGQIFRGIIVKRGLLKMNRLQRKEFHDTIHGCIREGLIIKNRFGRGSKDIIIATTLGATFKVKSIERLQDIIEQLMEDRK
jgi:hypothetical protein